MGGHFDRLVARDQSGEGSAASAIRSDPGYRRTMVITLGHEI
jgi:hypothetical protein